MPTYSARSGRATKGANGPTNGTPSFEITFDLTVGRPGPLWANVRASDGREWLVPVVSQGGAPLISAGIGGDGQDPAPPPTTALKAIHSELARCWESDPVDRATLMAAGFADGVRRPHQPGGHPESPEQVAVRVRRMLADRERRPNRRGRGIAGDPTLTLELALRTRRTWDNTERGVLKRARSEGIYSGGLLTERGVALVANVDRAKTAACEALAEIGEATLDELRARLPKLADAVIDAALFDLEADGGVELRACPACGGPRLVFRG